MTLKEFKQSMEDWHCYVDNAGGLKAMDRFPEDEQNSFYNGYKTAFPDIFAECNMDKVPENQQRTFPKRYYKGMQEVMRELK